MTLYEKIREFINYGSENFASLTQKEKRELIICAMHDKEECDGWEMLFGVPSGSATFLDYLKWANEKIMTPEECINKTIDEACVRQADWLEKKFKLQKREIDLENKDINYWIKKDSHGMEDTL